MQDLFKDNNHKTIQLNIEKLKNAAKYASSYFKTLGDLTEEEQSLLDNLSEATLFKARTLLDQNYDILKSMFTELPTFDIMKDHIESIKEEFHRRKNSKDLQNKASSSEGIESTDEEPRNSQNEDKLKMIALKVKMLNPQKRKMALERRIKKRQFEKANVYSEMVNNKMYDTHENLL